MIIAVQTSISALKAASTSLDVRADNIANIRATARVDQVGLDRSAAQSFTEDIFRPRKPSFIARENGGVEMRAEAADPSHVVIFDPSDGMADDNGLIAVPNVSLEENLVGVLQDRAMFLANLAVVRTADEMTGALLDDVV